MMKKELIPCPWCKKLPRYTKQTLLCNYDHAGNHYDKLMEIPSETIECANVHCKVRPNMTRINTNDAIKTWNTGKSNV